MAITINSQPDANGAHPAWNKIEYLVNSSNTAQSGFKIVCKVYDDPNGTNTLIQQLDLYTRPGTTKVYVDIHQILQSYIEDTYSILSGDSVDAQNQDLMEVGVSFQEYYSGALQGSATDASDIWIWRASFSLAQWIDGAFIDWQLNTAAVTNQTANLLNGFDNVIAVTGSTNPTLSAANKFLKMKSGQKQQIRYLSDTRGSTPSLRIYVALYDSSFNVTDSDYIDQGAIAEGKLYSLDIGTSELSGHTWVGTGLTPTSTDKYMAVWIYSSTASIALTSAKLFELDWDACFGYTNYEVHWLNRYGGFDSYTFNNRSIYKTEVKQSTYKNDAIEISGTSIVNTTSKRNVIPFFTKLKENYEINSNNLKQWEYEGMRDLLTSPEVYIILNGDFYSATIMDNKQITNFRDEDGEVYQMSFKLQIDTNETRQW